MIGLLLIALGTGGIKPCVSAFGGDQFNANQVCNIIFVTLQDYMYLAIYDEETFFFINNCFSIKFCLQEHLLQSYFSIFYFAINLGSLLSMIVTPMLRGRCCPITHTCTLYSNVEGNTIVPTA